MTNAEQATTPKGLWLLVVAAPIIVALQHETNYVLVRQACSVQRNVALYVVTLVSLVLTALAAFIAVRIWKRAGVAWPTEAGDVATRIRFVSVMGILSSAMSFLIIFAQGIATVQFDPCQL